MGTVLSTRTVLRAACIEGYDYRAVDHWHYVDKKVGLKTIFIPDLCIFFGTGYHGDCGVVGGRGTNTFNRTGGVRRECQAGLVAHMLPGATANELRC